MQLIFRGGFAIRDLDNLIEMEVAISAKGHVFRGQTPGVAGKVFQACGVALPPINGGAIIDHVPPERCLAAVEK